MKITKKIIVIIACILTITFGGKTFNVEALEKSGTYNIKSLDFNDSTEDLMFLKDKLKDVEIVGVGEATHFTKEFFQFRHKMLKFLVEEMGYKAFVLEIPIGCGEEINKYVNTGEGDLDNIIDRTSWLQASQEFKDTIEWIKNYNSNQNEENKVRVYGLDINFHPAINYAIVDYISIVNKDLGGYLPNVYSIVSTGVAQKIYELSKQELEENKDIYIQKTSESEYYRYMYLVNGLKISLDYDWKKTTTGTTLTVRDELMFNNLTWFKEYEEKYFNNSKMLVSAHNSHISKSFNEKVLGTFIYEKYKEKFYSVGVDFYNGSFIAENIKVGICKNIINESPDSNLSTNLKSLEEDMLFIDIDDVLNNYKLKEIFNKPQGMYVIGSGFTPLDFNEQNIYKFDIPKSFDGIFYVETTNAGTIFDNVRVGKDYIVDGPNKGIQETGGNISKEEIEQNKNMRNTMIFISIFGIIIVGFFVWGLRKLLNKKKL